MTSVIGRIRFLRVSAWVLLVFGFLWLALIDFETVMKGGLRSVIEAEYSKLDSSDQIYEKDEVRRLMVESVLAGYGTRPSVVIPGLMMLFGGVVLARTRPGGAPRLQ